MIRHKQGSCVYNVASGALVTHEIRLHAEEFIRLHTEEF